MRIRLWMAGAVCMACGLVVLVAFDPPDYQGQVPGQTYFLAACFGLGLLLLAVPIVKQLYTPGEPTRGELVSCVLWVVGALFSVVLLFARSGTRP